MIPNNRFFGPLAVLSVFFVLVTHSLQAQSFITNGLAAYYPLDGNAIDASGNGMNGTVAGATLTTDRFGSAKSAYQFSGSNWIQLPDQILPVLPSELTLSAWVFAGNPPFTVQQQLMDLTTRRGECGFTILPDSSGSWVFGVHLQSAGWQNIQSPVTPNAWTHLAGTFKQGQYIQFWVNGTLVQSNSIPGDTLFTLPGYELNSALGIYDWAPGPYLGFTGAMDDVRIYNRALSSEEVQQLEQFEAARRPMLSLIKAVKPAFSLLSVGTNYQLQVSADLVSWTNHGSPFTATNSNMTLPEYWDVGNWTGLYFRLQAAN
jgi:Concanavalin A-like lectin/glucanases superfamily